MTESLTAIERWNRWMLLDHGSAILPSLPELRNSYLAHSERFTHNKLYFGCGYDFDKVKYADWDMCDVRDLPPVIPWDVLLGLPYNDGVLELVKSKLTLGMFTWHQARFVLREVARVLKVGGTLDLTFRDFDRLLSRRDELDDFMFNRYIYGSSLYYGSRRKSCWTRKTLLPLVAQFHLVEINETCRSRGMNTNVFLVRKPGDLSPYTPEPQVAVDPEGNFVNDGDDFHKRKK